MSGRCIDDERLVEFYRGRTSAAEDDEVREHLAACRACLERSRDARAFLEAMAPERRRSWVVAASLAAAACLAVAALLVVRDAGPERAAAWEELAVVPPDLGASADVLWRGPAAAGQTDALAVASRHLREGRYDAAERVLVAHVAEQPRDEAGALLLAVARLLDGRAPAAVADLEALTRSPSKVAADHARWYLAVALARSGREHRARSELVRVASVAGPHRSEAARALARLAQDGRP